jgi:GxxExxY protein
VHRALGPGLLESAYQVCLAFEMGRTGLDVATDVPLPLVYEGIRLECGYRIDAIVDSLVVVEIKSVGQLAPIHEARLLTYLKLTGLPAGLLINFNVPLLKQGVKRRLNPNSQLPSP